MKTPKTLFPILIGFFALVNIFQFGCKNGGDTPAKGTINGRVTIEGTQVPVEGVVIEYQGARDGSITTNSEGAFNITELPIGEYTLTPNVPNSFKDVTPFVRTVRSGLPTRADFSLTPKGEVSGKISAEGSTNGIVGASVLLLGGPENISESKTTDISGLYSFTGVLDGAYTLEISHPDYSSVTRELNVFDGGSIRADIALAVLGPIIEVVPTTIDFGTNENQLSIDIRNEGRAELNWEIQESRDELSSFPTSGTVPAKASQPVSLSLDRTGLEAGDYQYNITVQSNDMSVTLNILFRVE